MKYLIKTSLLCAISAANELTTWWLTNIWLHLKEGNLIISHKRHCLNVFLLHYVSDTKIITLWVLSIDTQLLRKRALSSNSSPVWKGYIQHKMFHNSRYRLTFHPSRVFCPVCSLPGNRRVPLHPCCVYPGELCPDSHVEFPVNSVLALRSSSYRLAAEPLNVMSLSSRNFRSSTVIDADQVQTTRDINREENNCNSGRLKRLIFKISTSLTLNFTGCAIH